MRNKKIDNKKNKALKSVGSIAKRTLIREKINIELNPNSPYKEMNYSRKSEKSILYFKNGYDLLQYSIVIKPYIYKKYNMKSPLDLDMLLYLFPIQFFSSVDFTQLPLRQHNITLKGSIEAGYIELAIVGSKGLGAVYTLSEKSVRIVRDYYEHLSGEKVLNPDSYTNPFKKKNAAHVDRTREKLMLKLKRQTEYQPSVFRKGLYNN